ncbi:MAG: hypothetical protein ACE3L7_17265 [Candidatus Pristimantibacillus sp.]
MSYKRWVRRKMRVLFLGLACFLVFSMFTLSGCGRNTDSNYNAKQAKTYGHDGYLGYSNSNPNIPNNHTYLNYKSDGKFVGEVLSRLDGIKHNQLHFNGEHLRVDIKVDPSLTDTEMQELQQKAQKLVQENMPRYEVKVKAIR